LTKSKGRRKPFENWGKKKGQAFLLWQNLGTMGVQRYYLHGRGTFPHTHVGKPSSKGNKGKSDYSRKRFSGNYNILVKGCYWRGLGGESRGPGLCTRAVIPVSGIQKS